MASVPQSEQLAMMSESLLAKGKGTEPSAQIARWERAKVSKSHTLSRERGKSEREHGEDRVDK